jgi:hypothetical protein
VPLSVPRAYNDMCRVVSTDAAALQLRHLRQLSPSAASAVVASKAAPCTRIGAVLSCIQVRLLGARACVCKGPHVCKCECECAELLSVWADAARCASLLLGSPRERVCVRAIGHVCVPATVRGCALVPAHAPRCRSRTSSSYGAVSPACGPSRWRTCVFQRHSRWHQWPPAPRLVQLQRAPLRPAMPLLPLVARLRHLRKRWRRVVGVAAQATGPPSRSTRTSFRYAWTTARAPSWPLLRASTRYVPCGWVGGWGGGRRRERMWTTLCCGCTILYCTALHCTAPCHPSLNRDVLCCRGRSRACAQLTFLPGLPPADLRQNTQTAAGLQQKVRSWVAFPCPRAPPCCSTAGAGAGPPTCGPLYLALRAPRHPPCRTSGAS